MYPGSDPSGTAPGGNGCSAPEGRRRSPPFLQSSDFRRSCCGRSGGGLQAGAETEWRRRWTSSDGSFFILDQAMHQAPIMVGERLSCELGQGYKNTVIITFLFCDGSESLLIAFAKSASVGDLEFCIRWIAKNIILTAMMSSTHLVFRLHLCVLRRFNWNLESLTTLIGEFDSLHLHPFPITWQTFQAMHITNL